MVNLNILGQDNRFTDNYAQRIKNSRVRISLNWKDLIQTLIITVT